MDDPLVAELGTVEEHVESVDERLIAAPVRRERRLGGGALGRLEVGVDVGAAERVHGLFRVADQDQRRVLLREGAAHDLPLDWICVLKLVDQGDLVELAEPRARGRAVVLVGKRVPEPREQVVVGHHSATALAHLDFLPHGLGEAAPHRPLLGLVARLSLLRLETRMWAADRGRADSDRLRSAECRRRGVSVKAAHVEVVDHLEDQVGEVLDEDRVALDVAGDAEPREHVLAEPVRGRDGGGVEARDGVGEASPPFLDLGVRALGEQFEHAVVLRRRDADERTRKPELRSHESFTDPLAQLAGRHARERHDEKALRRNAFGDEPRNERGDRVCLPRTGARFEQGHAAGKRAAKVELRDVGRSAHRSISSSAASRSSHMRRAYRPALECSSTAQPALCSSGRGCSANSSARVRVPPSTRRCS